MPWLPLLLIGVPLLELWLLTKVGAVLGLGGTILLVAVTGLVGAGVLKRESARVWSGWARALETGERPEAGLVDGVLIMLGGLLLLTPGILTDLLGLTLVFEPTRAVVAWLIRGRLHRLIDAQVAAQRADMPRGAGAAPFARERGRRTPTSSAPSNPTGVRWVQLRDRQLPQAPRRGGVVETSGVSVDE